MKKTLWTDPQKRLQLYPMHRKHVQLFYCWILTKILQFQKHHSLFFIEEKEKSCLKKEQCFRKSKRNQRHKVHQKHRTLFLNLLQNVVIQKKNLSSRKIKIFFAKLKWFLNSISDIKNVYSIISTCLKKANNKELDLKWNKNENSI